MRVEQATARAGDVALLAEMALADLGEDGSLLLIPFHSSDSSLLDAVRTELTRRGLPDERLRTVPYPLSEAAEAFRLLSTCEVVISMRYHPALAATMARRRLRIVELVAETDLA